MRSMKSIGNKSYTIPDKPHDFIGGQFSPKKYVYDIERKNVGDDLPFRYEIKNIDTKINLDQTDYELTYLKEDLKKDRSLLDIKWNKLTEKEEMFRKHFIQFKHFVQSNVLKRARALDKTEENIKLRNERQIKLTELQEQFDCLLTDKCLLQDQINSLEKYKSYLLSVCDDCPQFASIDDIIDRFTYLIFAKTELGDTYRRQLLEIHQSKNKLAHIIRNKQDTISEMRNQINDLKERYKRTKLNCTKWETILFEVESVVQKKLLDKILVEDVCEQMYTHMCETKRVAAQSNLSFEKRLEFIKQTLKEIQAINRKRDNSDERNYSRK